MHFRLLQLLQHGGQGPSRLHFAAYLPTVCLLQMVAPEKELGAMLHRLPVHASSRYPTNGS